MAEFVVLLSKEIKGSLTRQGMQNTPPQKTTGRKVEKEQTLMREHTNKQDWDLRGASKRGTRLMDAHFC